MAKFGTRNFLIIGLVAALALLSSLAPNRALAATAVEYGDQASIIAAVIAAGVTANVYTPTYWEAVRTGDFQSYYNSYTGPVNLINQAMYLLYADRAKFLQAGRKSCDLTVTDIYFPDGTLAGPERRVQVTAANIGYETVAHFKIHLFRVLADGTLAEVPGSPLSESLLGPGPITGSQAGTPPIAFWDPTRRMVEFVTAFEDGELNLRASVDVVDATGATTGDSDFYNNSRLATILVTSPIVVDANYLPPVVSPKESFVPSGTLVQLTVANGQAPFTWTMNPTGQPEGYCATAFDAATGAVTAGLYSIHDGSNRTPQSFTVTDVLGNSDIASIVVFPKPELQLGSAACYPGTMHSLAAYGGVNAYGDPWTFAIAENRTGGSILNPDPAAYRYQPMYQAGPNPGVDVVEATDIGGNKARAEVTVGAPPVVSPAAPTVDRNGTIQFSFAGGLFPPDAAGRSWMMVENNSGGSIGNYDGLYSAGPTGGTDVIALHDVNGYLAKVTVTVFQPAPVISGVTDARGPQGGGTTFTISGQNLDQPVSVKVGGLDAIVQSASADGTQLVVSAPASGSLGPQDIVVITGGGSATLTGGFEYIPAPTIANVWPNQGPKAGGNEITIYGSNFKGATQIMIGYTPVATFSVFEDGNSITFIAPSSTIFSPQNVSVTAPGGSAVKTGAYTYFSPPAISSFSPTSAPVGFTIAIYGSRLSTTSSVTFNGVRADFTVVSNSRVNARVPDGATSGPVVVTAVGGTTSKVFTVTP